MEILSVQLEDLSVQVKNARDHASKAESQAKEQLHEQRERVRGEVHATLEKVKSGIGHASTDVQVHASHLKAKVESDFEHLKQRTLNEAHKFEAWHANNRVKDKEAHAQYLIDYAVAAVKMADLGVLDAIDARLRAEEKTERVQQPEPTAA